MKATYTSHALLEWAGSLLNVVFVCRQRTGMEYILQDAQEPHLFVIRKQKRESPEKVSAQAAYYVLDGSIYQAPHLYNVIGSRVVSCYK